MERNEKGQFVKGGKMTAEDLVKKSRGLIQSWKSRDNYIGDIKNAHPRIYNSWRAIMTTTKGKAAGHVKEWGSFRTFYNDVVPTYEKGLVLRRKDILFPWGPDNFMWVTPAEAGETRTKVTLEYQGKNLSLKQWADELNTSIAAIKCRYFKHKDEYSVEEILFGRKTDRGSKKTKDVLSEPERVRAKASKMISSYKAHDKKNGTEVCDISIEWMVNNILLKPCVYCGDTKRIGCDRIDNTKGHIMSNVVPCCIECNTARNSFFSYDEMRILGRTIAEIKANRVKEQSKFTESDVQKFLSHDLSYRRQRTCHKTYQFSLDGSLLAEYNSVNDAASSVGITPKAISAASCGKNHGTHKCGGYLWSHNKTIEIK